MICSQRLHLEAGRLPRSIERWHTSRGEYLTDGGYSAGWPPSCCTCPMPDLIYNQAHVRLRKELVAALVDGTPCWRCGKGMFRGQRLQLGHADSPDGP